MTEIGSSGPSAIEMVDDVRTLYRSKALDRTTALRKIRELLAATEAGATDLLDNDVSASIRFARAWAARGAEGSPPKNLDRSR